MFFITTEWLRDQAGHKLTTYIHFANKNRYYHSGKHGSNQLKEVIARRMGKKIDQELLSNKGIEH